VIETILVTYTFTVIVTRQDSQAKTFRLRQLFRSETSKDAGRTSSHVRTPVIDSARAQRPGLRGAQSGSIAADLAAFPLRGPFSSVAGRPCRAVAIPSSGGGHRRV